MPLVQRPSTPNAAILYFWSAGNPFGNYPEIKKLLEGKHSDVVKQDAYGYAEDTANRMFPLFGSWNIVARDRLPETGTNYMVCDPSGGRNIATIWARVTPGRRPDIFIYRDWPDARTYGEWAVPSDHPETFDGDMGPAQRPLGLGVQEYKQTWREAERIRPVFAEGRLLERDPHRRRAAERALRAAGFLEKGGVWQGEEADLAAFARETEAREEIFLRLIDSRAGRNQVIAERGGTCLIDQFAETHEAGGRVLPGLNFIPASGVGIDEGITAVNELLYWDRGKPLAALANAPRLFVCEECLQVIWALSNYTGRDGEKGACKDFVDVVRYLALENPMHIPEGGLKAKPPWGGY